jgi:hypothetical protein
MLPLAMRRLLLPLLATLALPSCGTPGGGGALWSQAYGASAFSAAHAVASSPTGELVFAGSLRAGPDGTTADLGGGALPVVGREDAFVAKLAPDGSPVWSRAFGTAGGDGAAAIAVSSAGDVFVAGTLAAGKAVLGGVTLSAQGPSDVFVARLDAAGKPVWGRVFAVAGEASVHALAVGADGAPVVVGDFHGQLDLGGTVVDSLESEINGFVARLDGASGAPLWGTSLRSATSARATGVAVTPAGAVVLTGTFFYDVILGDLTLKAPDTYGATYLIALDGAGQPTWSKAFGSTRGTALAAGPDGGIVLTGRCDGPVDFGEGPLAPVTSGIDEPWFLASFAADGAPRWSLGLGDVWSDAERGPAVTIDSQGATVAAYGGIDPLQGGGPQVFLRKVDAAGAPVWTRGASGGHALEVGGVAAAPDDEVLLVGSLAGSLDLGAGPMTPPGAQGFFAARLGK